MIGRMKVRIKERKTNENENYPPVRYSILLIIYR